MTTSCLECGIDITGQEERFCSRVCGAKWLSVMLEVPPATATNCLDVDLCGTDAQDHPTQTGAEQEHVPKSRKCTRCGDQFTTGGSEVQGQQEQHHIIPRAAGGPDHPLNLVKLCHGCHMQAHRDMKRLPEEKPELLVELRDFVCTP